MADFSTYEGRQAYRDAHPGVIVDASGAYNPHTGQTVTGSSGGGGGGGSSSPGPLPQAAGGAPVYQTVNGPKTVDQMMNELFANGWDGSGDITQVYARTTGGGVAPAGVGGVGGGPGVPGTNVTATNDPTGILNQINSALGNFSSQASGVTQAELAERKRQFDLTLQRQMEMWNLQGLPTLVIQQKAQQLAEQEFESQKQLAQQAQALATAGVTGVFNGAPTMAAQQQAFAQEAARAGLGLQYMQTAASLGGPENTFQLSNFERGAQGTPDVPVFLQNLASNTRMPVFTAPGTTPPNVLTAGSIANRLTGNAGGVGFNPDASLGAIRNVANAGAQSLAPGSLERLSPDELAAFGSGLKAVGNSLPAFLQSYANSRLGQSAIGGDIGLAA